VAGKEPGPGHTPQQRRRTANRGFRIAPPHGTGQEYGSKKRRGV
jgi:hypothetical protein